MDTIKLNNEDWPLDYVAFMLFGAKRSLIFKKDIWKPRDALYVIGSNRYTIYTGQKYDKKKFKLLKNHWDHDHCLICNWTFYPTNKNDKIEGNTNGYDWICNECFEKVLSNKEIMAKLKKYHKKRK